MLWNNDKRLREIIQSQQDQESARVHDLLVYGIAAARAQSIAEARNYLDAVLNASDASMDQRCQAYRWLAEISDDPKIKRDYYEQILGYNPADPEARRGLAILDGKLDPNAIVDPNQVAPETPVPIQARRFVCTHCGGKMAFAPDGNSLTCEYCGRKQSLLSALDDSAMIEEQDMTLALATSKGHSAPQATQSIIKCQGCGAAFVLPPQRLSDNCPYCDSAYVIEYAESRDLIQPEGVVPFAITREQAHQIVFEWYKQQGYRVLSDKALPSGVYLPVWTFDLAGEITWTCQVKKSEDVWMPRLGAYLVYENDLRVAASHTLSATLMQEIDQFPLERLAPYDPGYLADLPAETYQISVSDGSLVARSRALEKSRTPIQASILASYRDLQLSTLRLAVDSYKLILVPLWIARYQLKDKWYTVIVNGQTGKARGEKPTQGVMGWLNSLLNG